jgi:N6-adenosine-specific RNA methylase IME4
VPAASNALLFLWRTAPMAAHAHKVMEAWGFDYRTEFIWVKNRISTGFWNRNQHEVLMLGVKGSVPAPVQGDQFSSYQAAAIGKHSQKPDVFYEIIERMFPNQAKLEMFARKRRHGWTSWGNEASS